MRTYAVAIVGAGPIGLELAAALKHAGIDYLHLEGGQIGQTITWYPRQARFFSSPDRIAIAGVPLQTVDQGKATREEYLAYLRGVVEQFDLEVQTYERVVAIDRPTEAGQPFTLRTRHAGADRTWQAAKLVLAVGDMHRPRLLQVPGEDLPHVSHYFEEPHRYFRQRLLIVGGRNSAVEAAVRCHRAGARVAISYRRPDFDAESIKYWLLPEIRSLVKSGQIRFYPSTTPIAIRPGEVDLRQADNSTTVPADFVLALTGYEMDPALFRMAGVTLAGPQQGPVFDADTMETDVPGVFVAGTAAAGSQTRYRLFIENCHLHVQRIVAALTGQAAKVADRPIELPES